MVSAITLDRDRFSPAVLDGLSKLSHVEVLFHLHGVDESSIITGRKHPRGNVKRPEVGIFAQRRVWEATTMNATAKELTA
jgi:tRNA (Thr-GGU) A37 N-methylase